MVKQTSLGLDHNVKVVRQLIGRSGAGGYVKKSQNFALLSIQLERYLPHTR